MTTLPHSPGARVHGLAMPLAASRCCSKCGKEKPIAEFHASAHHRGGYRPECKVCTRAKQAIARAVPEAAAKQNATAKAWRAANPERVKANNIAYREARPGDNAARTKAWKLANPERFKARMIAWHAAHPGAQQRSIAAWWANNSDYRAAYKLANTEKVRAWGRAASSKRRARLRGVRSTLTARDIAEVFVAFGMRCAYCLRDDVAMEIDHVDPVSRGGDHVPENIVPACRSCNARKSGRGILYMLNRCLSAA